MTRLHRSVSVGLVALNVVPIVGIALLGAGAADAKTFRYSTTATSWVSTPTSTTRGRPTQ